MLRTISVWPLRRLLYFLVLCSIVPALAAFSWYAYNDYKKTLADVKHQALASARAVVAQQTTLEKSVETLLTTLSHLLASKSMDSGALREIFEKIHVQTPRFSTILFADPGGDVLISAVRNQPVPNLAGRKYFRDAVASRAFSAGEFVLGNVTGSPIFHYSMPVFEADRLLGVLAATLPVDRFDTYFADTGLPSGSRLLLLDHAGRRLLHFPPRPESPLGQPAIPSLVDAVQALGGDEMLFDDYDQTGLRVVYAVVRLRLKSQAAPYMAVVVGIPYPSPGALFATFLWKPMAMLLGSVLAALIVARLLGDRTVCSGLEQLVVVTKELAAGRLSTRAADLPACREVRTLARSINRMGSALLDENIRRLCMERDLAANEAILREALAWKETMLDNSAVGIAATSEAGRIAEINAGFAEMFGCAGEALVGSDFSRLFVDAGAFEACCSLRGGASDGRHFEVAMRRADGTAFWCVLAGRLVASAGAKATVWVAVDIDARRQAEAELRTAKTLAEELARKAEAASEAKSQFLANMSHEIRTPLNGVLGMLQLLGTTPLSPEQGEYVEAAAKSCKRLTNLLADILDLSRIESGRLLVCQELFRIEDVRGAVVELFEPAARDKGVALRVVVDDAVPRHLIGDETRLRQIAFNLVGNAVKFTARGEVRLDIGLQRPATKTACRLLLTVSDTGIGIDDGQLARIFEPFIQAEGTFTRAYQGAGLGLAIVRRLVVLLGGSLAVDNTPGGTTFYVSAPFGLPSLPRPEPEAGPPAALPPAGCAPGEPGLRVLLAEDDAPSRVACLRALERAGHRVTAVDNGQAVLELLERQEFDVALLDMQMPVINGMEAMRHIREGRAGNPDIPIVAVTGYAMFGDDARFLAAGADGYIAKPVDFATLTATVARVHAAKRGPTPATAPPTA